MSDWFFIALLTITAILTTVALLPRDPWWRLSLKQRLMIARQRRKVFRNGK